MILALHSIRINGARYAPNDEIKGLTPKQIEELTQAGAILEIPDPEPEPEPEPPPKRTRKAKADDHSDSDGGI